MFTNQKTQYQCNFSQNPTRVFCRNWQAESKFTWKSKEPRFFKTILKRRTKLEDLYHVILRQMKR